MCGSSWLLSSSCRTCDGIDSYVVCEESSFGKRQKSELYACGEASRVGQVLASCYCVSVCLWQAVNIVVVALDAEVLRQVDNLHACRYGVLFEESFALAMSETEEHHIDIVEWHFACELQLGVAEKAFVNVIHLVARI